MHLSSASAAKPRDDNVNQVTIRVYGSLNDFLPPERQQVAWEHSFEGRTSVKDLIEGLGVPHPEIDLLLVNGQSVPFDCSVRNADRIAVFPGFHSLDIGSLTQVRPQPLDVTRFVLDGHLGKLARHLRLFGIDTAYRVDARDDELADLARRERRIVLTRDRALLKRSVIAHGYFVRDTLPFRQLVEVLRRFGPLPVAPFKRCIRCNGEVREVPKSAVETELAPRTRRHYDRFQQCTGCGRIYWRGSHWSRLQRLVDTALREAGARAP
jgi:uncharacterized protein with PIN domain